MKTLPYEGSQLQRDIAATSNPEHLNAFKKLSESAVKEHTQSGKPDSVKFFQSAINDIDKKLKPRRRKQYTDGGTGHDDISYSDADPGL